MGCSGSTQTKAQTPASNNAPQQKPAEEPAVVPQYQTGEGGNDNTLPPSDNKQEIIENQDPVSSPKEQEAVEGEKMDEEKPNAEAESEPNNTRIEDVPAAEQAAPAEPEAQNEQMGGTATTESEEAPAANTCQENGEMIHETAVEPAAPQDDNANAQDTEQSPAQQEVEAEAQQETTTEPAAEPATVPQTEAEGGEAERPAAAETDEGVQDGNVNSDKPAEEE